MMQSDISDSIKFSYDDDSNNISFLTKLMNNTVKKINDIIDKREKFRLSEDEIKVGKALIELMNNWEDLFAQMGSDKFNKSSILLFLKETTLLNTKQIRDGMKKYKTAYYGIKSIMINS